MPVNSTREVVSILTNSFRDVITFASSRLPSAQARCRGVSSLVCKFTSRPICSMRSIMSMCPFRTAKCKREMLCHTWSTCDPFFKRYITIGFELAATTLQWYLSLLRSCFSSRYEENDGNNIANVVHTCVEDGRKACFSFPLLRHSDRRACLHKLHDDI